jgi:hypothetical protein
MLRKTALLLATGLSLMTPALARADVSIWDANVMATPVAVVFYNLEANSAYTIETLGLSTGSDTVLHVQRYDPLQGNPFLAGNDDSGGTRSLVNIAAAATLRQVYVVVRAYDNNSGGTATLRITRQGFSSQDFAITFGGVKRLIPSGLEPKFDVFTVEKQGGAANTVVMVLDGTAFGMSFDVDDGVGGMSWLRQAAACPSSTCYVVVGTRQGVGFPATSGSVGLGIDGDLADGRDNDGDGLGNSFETVRDPLLDPNKKDTDGDGLSDGVEVMGVTELGARAALKLPFYGADPLAKDLFVEVDWLACTSGCDPILGADTYRMTGTEAMAAAALYAPQIRVHIDNGIANTDPASRTTWGAWGGAGRTVQANALSCSGLQVGRESTFHQFLATSKGGGGQGQLGGHCAYGGNSGAALAHEMGHNLTVDHGGNSPSLKVNCKPNYRSVMSYSYAYRADVGFSRNRFSLGLNPTSLNETTGLGTADASVLADMSGGNFRYHVNTSTGAIDWNRDGLYSTSTRAAVTWNYGVGGCEQARFHGDLNLHADAGPTLAWLPSPKKLFLFSKNPSGSIFQLQYRTATAISGCDSVAWNASCTNWSGVSTMRSNFGNSSGVAAQAFNNNGWKMMVVYWDSSQGLAYQVGTPNADGSMSWTVGLDFSGDLVDSDPAIINLGTGGRLRAFARNRTTQELRSWEYDPATSQWSAPRIERWSDGTAIIVTTAGIGLTQGYQRDLASSGRLFFAAIPVPVTGGNQIELARYDAATGRWFKFPSSIWAQGRFPAYQRVGLTYVPYDRNVNLTDGRFLLSYSWSVGDAVQLTFSEGNDFSSGATTRQLKFQWSSFMTNMWDYSYSGVVLLNDLDNDTGARATYTFSQNAIETNRVVQFLPFVEGIANLTFKDQDDFDYLKPGLACSLGQSSSCIY